jgi:hypothetical protein
MLKQFKIITFALTCFGSRRNHHQRAVLCLAKTTKYGFFVLVSIDVVNIMAAQQADIPYQRVSHFLSVQEHAVHSASIQSPLPT